MKMLTLAEVNQHYEEIIHSNSPQNVKDVRLTCLITNLEIVFDVPMVPHKKYTEQQKEAHLLHKKLRMLKGFSDN